MLIATLPTLTGLEAQNLSEEIIGHSLIDAVRYNTGGASPYTPKQILEILKPMAGRHKKTLWVDLEGRQVRVSQWTPQSRGVVTLNRDFTIEVPGMIHFRGAGWFDIVNALPEERKIFFAPRKTREEYYFGESQSVNVVAKKFEVEGYLNGLDSEYIKAARGLGISHFMLSFVEKFQDISGFYEEYYKEGIYNHDYPLALPPKLVLKIESQKGIQFAQWIPDKYLRLTNFQLMAARDDLFLSFVNARSQFLDALKLIAEKDRNAILASRIMTGLLGYQNEVSIGDMTDIVLMNQLGYKNFMLPDELADSFEDAMKNWREIIMPLLQKSWLPEKKIWKKK